MATFNSQTSSSDSLLPDWKAYLQNRPIINKIEDIVQTQTKEFNKSIEHSAEMQIQAFQQSMTGVCESLDSGFEMLSNNLSEISYNISELRSEINAMASMLSWNLSLIIEQQRITNLLLGNIAVLLKIPDIQKERQYHVEQGIKFLKNSIFDPDFFEDALKNLLKAETIESSDFYSLHRIGLIYLYSLKHLDLVKAEEYFKKSAKYAIAETNSGASITINHLAGNLNQDLSVQNPTIDSIMLQATESYLYAGRSCYLQGKFKVAAELAGKAYSLVPSFVEAGFTQVQALSANNDISEATEFLETVIRKDRYYSFKTARDLNLVNIPEISEVLEKLRQEAYGEASELFSRCQANLIPESMAKKEFDIVENLIIKKSYLHCKKAIDLINKTQLRKFSDVYYIGNSVCFKENRNLTRFQKAFPEIMQNVLYPALYVLKFNDLFNLLSIKTQWIFPTFKSNSLIFPTNYESKKTESSLLFFLQKEKEYFDHLPAMIKQVETLIQEIYDDDVKVREEDNIRRRKQRKSDQISRNLASAGLSVVYAIYGAFAGAILGVIIGFFRSSPGLSPYGGTWDFSYFLPTLLTVTIVGAIIGFIAGILAGQK